ncbi:putative transporter like protein [Verticillium longisporum]|uniref:Putative transporter like protein n=1 Tax=Verticillium longisporum TaxID=100787 RepID=A0A8I2ZVZ8_VERLO|nr:putative transporter like protein [Verticillium longisporum]
MSNDQRPPFSRPTEGLSGIPLLFAKDESADDADRRSMEYDEARRGRASRGSSPLMASRNQSFHSRASTMRSHSPDLAAASSAKTRYTFAAFFLVLCLVAFVVQTELSAYVQQDLGWNKAYCMLYLTHGSWSLLWPVQLLCLRIQQYNVPWATFWRRHGCAPLRGVVFANTFGSCIGLFTLCVLWVPLPLLHWTGLETFALPTGHTAWMLFFSVIANATFAGSFLVLISLTSPVLSSVASLLTIFLVALTDWMVTGEPLSGAAMLGGFMIMVAFGMLSWSTWREMAEHEGHKPVDMTDSGDDSDMERED